MISIIGSCVTRDALEVVDGLKVGQYLARTSLASIGARRSAWINELPITFTDQAHPWHRRLVAADFEKTHAEQLAAMRDDHVVIDLIEERVDLVETEPGEYVTRNQVLSAMSDFDRFVPRRIRIFSPDGYSRWSESLPRFVDLLGRHVEPERVIIHRALYAPVRDDAEESNRYLEAMYDRLQEAIPQAQMVVPSAEVFHADPDHKWGPAPFHFIDAYYVEVARKILYLCGLQLPIKPAYRPEVPADPRS